MRVNLKGLLGVLVVGVFFTTVSYWTRCSDTLAPRPAHYAHEPMHRGFQTKYGLQGLQKDEAYMDDVGSFYSSGNMMGSQVRTDLNTNTFEEIECLINGEYSVSCRRDGREVYVPFTFLHKYFEVYGKVVSFEGGYERFEWQHSYSKFYHPHGAYDPGGPFMHFRNYNVEARDRVKCISAMDGVPVSTQWDAKGYYYPIQISQFGLSHYSKNLTEPEPRIVIYEDGDLHKGKWFVPDGYPPVDYRWERATNTRVMTFETPESLEEAGLRLKLDQSSDYILSLNFHFLNNGSITVSLEDREHHDSYFIHYVCSSTYITVEGNHVYYGLGVRTQWSRLTRDISIDFRKGFSTSVGGGSRGESGKASSKKSKIHFSKIKILHLTVRGSGALDNVTVSSSSHLAHFYDAAEWLLRNQDTRGGWPIPVERKFSSSGMANLQPGWYSAMAQGQAMSVLTRAFRTTSDARYLQAALRAVELFRVPSSAHGVRTNFLDKYVWYEEYPTIPSSYVLNGFIYALLGLYDLRTSCIEQRRLLPSVQHEGGSDVANGLMSTSCSSRDSKEVLRLYDDGMHSLKKMLPLFDSGATSIYDLRHFTLGIAPNLARWDYHTTHIDQLLLLSTIDDDPVLKTTAQRWIEYMKGKRASHN